VLNKPGIRILGRLITNPNRLWFHLATLQRCTVDVRRRIRSALSLAHDGKELRGKERELGELETGAWKGMTVQLCVVSLQLFRSVSPC
jgi:hypothetical protein